MAACALLHRRRTGNPAPMAGDANGAVKPQPIAIDIFLRARHHAAVRSRCRTLGNGAPVASLPVHELQEDDYRSSDFRMRNSSVAETVQ